MIIIFRLFVHIEDKHHAVQVDEYFKTHAWTEPLLSTHEGKQYAAPFRALRMKNLLLHDQDVKILYNDNLVPAEWLHDAYREQWLHLLRIDANIDRG